MAALDELMVSGCMSCREAQEMGCNKVVAVESCKGKRCVWQGCPRAVRRALPRPPTLLNPCEHLAGRSQLGFNGHCSSPLHICIGVSVRSGTNKRVLDTWMKSCACSINENIDLN